MEAVVFPHLGQGSGGRPVAGKPHAGKYREVTLWRQRGGRGTLTLSLTHSNSQDTVAAAGEPGGGSKAGEGIKDDGVQGLCE